MRPATNLKMVRHVFRDEIRQTGQGIIVQWSPLVRSAFCPMKIYHTSGLTLHPGIHFTVIKGCKKMKTHLAVFFAKNCDLISKYHTLVDFNLEFGMQLEILAHIPQNNAI